MFTLVMRLIELLQVAQLIVWDRRVFLWH